MADYLTLYTVAFLKNGCYCSAFGIVVIFILHLFIQLYEFVAAGIIARRNPFRLLYNMLPAYFTALGTSSSAATIPVTLKQTMRNGVSDIIVALPGGMGTLDEIFTVVAAHTIGYHNKRVIVYDLKGFWGKLIELLDDMQERGFVRGSWHDYIDVAHSLDDIAKLCVG